MKITSIELLPASKYLFIKLYTDEGIYGTGEVGAWGYLDGCTGILKKMEGYLIGQDPFRIEHHWNYLYRSMYFRGSILMSALSAIDIALWDIRERLWGCLCMSFWAENAVTRCEAMRLFSNFTPEEIAQRCVELKEMGFDAARLMITGDIRLKQAKRRSSVYNAKVSDYIKVVKAVREAVGDEFDMILECHRSMDPMEAIAFAKGVEEYRPLFLEDPIPPDSPESMADIAIRTNIPIATGERFINIQEFETIFQKHAAKYVRPDVCALGGLTPSKKVAAMAEANYCKIVPHNPLGPVSTAACLQLDAAIPNFAIQEFPSFYHQGNEAEMTKEAFEEEAGYIVVPDRPGIGIELVDDICERFPANQEAFPRRLPMMDPYTIFNIEGVCDEAEGIY